MFILFHYCPLVSSSALSLHFSHYTFSLCFFTPTSYSNFSLALLNLLSLFTFLTLLYQISYFIFLSIFSFAFLNLLLFNFLTLLSHSIFSNFLFHFPLLFLLYFLSLLHRSTFFLHFITLFS